MTVDTAIKIEGEKCGLDVMHSCEDVPPSSVGGGAECNGDGKDDYVFVNGSDTASDDHVEVEGNGELDVSASNADLEGKLEGFGLNVVHGGDQLEPCDGYSDKLENVIKVNGKQLEIENGNFVEEERDGNAEIKSESEGIVEDKEAVVGSNDTANVDCQIEVKIRNLEFVEETDVGNKVKDGEFGIEKRDETNASDNGISYPSLDDDEKERKLQGIDSGSDVVPNGATVVEVEPLVPHAEIEDQPYLGRSEGHENEVEEFEKPKDMAKKPEVVDNVNSDIAEVLVTDSELVNDIIMESKLLEADTKHESRENGIIETDPYDDLKALDSEAEELVPDDAMTEKQSQQQALQPGDSGEAGSVKAEAEVKVQDDSGTPRISESQELHSVDTEASVCELQQSAESEVNDQDASESTTEPEECVVSQSVPESEGAANKSNLELATSEMDRPVQKSIDQSDEVSVKSMAEVNGVPETATDDVQSDNFEKSLVDHELDGVHGQAKAELTAQTGGSLESSVQEVSHQDQVAKETGLVDVADKKVYTEDVTSEKTGTVEEATDLSVQKVANEAVADEGQDLDVSYLVNGVAENEVYAPESSHDSGICLRSEDVDLTVPVGNAVDLPVPCDSDIRKGVTVEDGSCARDGGISSSADDSYSQPKLENSNNTLHAVDGTTLEVKPVNGEVDVANKTNHDFEDILEPKISFGSFGCVAPFSLNNIMNSQPDAVNRSTEFTVSQSDSVGNSESIIDTINGASILSSDANDARPTELDPDKTCAGAVSSEKISTEEDSASLPEGSGADSSDGQNVNPDLVRRPFYYLIRIPKFDDVTLSDQIKQSEEEVYKKTQNRDAVRIEYQDRKAIYWESKTIFETAKSEERAAHRLLIAKLREIDSAQSLISLAKNAITVEDVDSRILNMERRIQHETLDLAEEKRLVREIKQLNRQREQLAANTRRQQELQRALDQRVETEENLKVLRKELDALRDKHAKTEESLKAAKKKYDEESTLLNDLKAKFSSADTIRQEAYARLQTLKKQAFEKNKLFYNYKDAAKVAYDLAGAGKKDSLEQHCVNQVEKIMELWNKNDEFRKEYIRCNQRSTLRRFKTLDGRSLGPDEEQPSLGNISDNRFSAVAKVNSVATMSTIERDFPLVAKKAQDEPSKKDTEQKNKIVLGKKKGEPITMDSPAEPSGRIEIENKEEEIEVHKLTKEEEEFARKEEQKRKEEEAAQLRERRREEEKAKAQEAQERKKRMAEKAQARAEFKARKAAEEKEKERVKRAKKKEKKKGIISEITEIEPAKLPESSPSEIIREPEVSEKPVTVTKKSHKPALYTKQVKTTKSISAPPAPLRNRGKRKVPQWVWWLVVAILSVILIFPLGNIDIVGRFKNFNSGPSH